MEMTGQGARDRSVYVMRKHVLVGIQEGFSQCDDEVMDLCDFFGGDELVLGVGWGQEGLEEVRSPEA